MFSVNIEANSHFILYVLLKTLKYNVKVSQQSPNLKGIPVSRALNIIRSLNYDWNGPVRGNPVDI